jgi:hypothetical protein
VTHYLLRLCTPNKEWGKKATVLAEVHKDLPRPEYGWSRMMHGKARPYFTCAICALGDDQADADLRGVAVCRRYQVWLEHKDAHEDDLEATALLDEVRGPQP